VIEWIIGIESGLSDGLPSSQICSGGKMIFATLGLVGVVAIVLIIMKFNKNR